MSRIIVKNLPKKITEEKLRETFSAKGYVTDVQLKYTPEGKFRGFAFVGFKKADEADAAIEFFDGTYIGATKAAVEKCAALGSKEKPRAWSKYAEGSSAHARAHGEKKPTADETPGKEKKKKGGEADSSVDDKFKEVLEDPAFSEFLAVHEKKGSRALWADDTAVVGGGTATLQDGQTSGSSGKKPPAPETGEDSGVEEADEPEPATADMDFLRSKMVKKSDSGSDDDSDSDGEAENKSDTAKKTKKSAKKATPANKSPVVRKFDLQFTVKLTGLPSNAKKKDVRQFLAPLKPKSIRLPPRTKSIAFIGLQNEKELKLAINKHRTFLNGRRIDVKRHEERPAAGAGQPVRWEEQKRRLQDVEPVAETGRIYVRNLAYSVTEDDLRQLFVEHGELTEVNLPVDRYSRKIKGFAFVSYLFPERAERAVAALDGSVFQGRMLHLLPAHPLRNDDEDGDQPTTDFKAKKEKQLKKEAGSSHNWNSLFLGANAVADLMAEKYNVDKSAVLDTSGQGSAAVRLALGETQLISETKAFLEEHGVLLDAFSRPATQRSGTVILAKNLPAHTSPAQLRELFSKHAVIEFLEPSEARTAFRSLAYTRFKNAPLYLEWAPADALGEVPSSTEPAADEPTASTEEPAVNTKKEDAEEEEAVDSEEGATLFVKNISFETTDEALREHFAGCGKLVSAAVSWKKDAKRPGQLLSQGYGFVSFQRKKHAQKALKQLQLSELDGHALQLKVSNRTRAPEAPGHRKKQDGGKQKSSKILVRNVPFQANKSEIVELFKTFGELAAVRLPQKMAGVGTGPHRGFAFIEFTTRQDAKRAFAALCASTHLYGRRLVLEWAAADDDVETLRLKTAAHFSGDAPSKKRVKLDDDQPS